MKEGNKGAENCRTWSCILVVEKRVGARSLGSKEPEEAILMTGAVNAMVTAGETETPMCG
jgi:hypothetical protein